MEETVTVTTRIHNLGDGRLEITVTGTPEELDEVFTEEFIGAAVDAVNAQKVRPN